MTFWNWELLPVCCWSWARSGEAPGYGTSLCKCINTPGGEFQSISLAVKQATKWCLCTQRAARLNVTIHNIFLRHPGRRGAAPRAMPRCFIFPENVRFKKRARLPGNCKQHARRIEATYRDHNNPSASEHRLQAATVWFRDPLYSPCAKCYGFSHLGKWLWYYNQIAFNNSDIRNLHSS